MISYAQNQEDVVLSRLIKVVPKGVFVDVGAGHPVLENPTYALYQAGWRGINIEPMAREVELFAKERPEDITLNIAVGAEPGKVTLFEAPLENRGATTSDEAIADRYRQAGQQFTSFEVEVSTIAQVLKDHPHTDVHVFKIDVEGMEPEVIEGADLATMKPWVIVVEATVPNSTESSAESFEPAVLKAGYVCTLFDGLNRFYVREDLTDIQRLLSAPANVFDNWTPYLVQMAIDERDKALADAADLRRKFAEADQEHAKAYALAVEAAQSAEAYAASLVQARDEMEPHLLVLQTQAQRVDDLQIALDIAKSEIERLSK